MPDDPPRARRHRPDPPPRRFDPDARPEPAGPFTRGPRPPGFWRQQWEWNKWPLAIALSGAATLGLIVCLVVYLKGGPNRNGSASSLIGSHWIGRPGRELIAAHGPPDLTVWDGNTDTWFWLPTDDFGKAVAVTVTNDPRPEVVSSTVRALTEREIDKAAERAYSPRETEWQNIRMLQDRANLARRAFDAVNTDANKAKADRLIADRAEKLATADKVVADQITRRRRSEQLLGDRWTRLGLNWMPTP